MNKVKHFLLAGALAVSASLAEAAWTYDSSAKTLSDGNWTFTVDEVTVGDVEGLRICSNSYGYQGGDTVIDFTSCPTDATCGKPVVAVNIKFNTAMPATKFIAPDVLTLTSQATFNSQQCLEEIYLPNCTNTYGQTFNGLPNLAKVTIRGVGPSAVQYVFNNLNGNNNHEFDLYWTGEEIPTTFAYGCFSVGSTFRFHSRGKALNNWLNYFLTTSGNKTYTFCLREDFDTWGYKWRLKDMTIPDTCKAVVWEWRWSYFWICEWEYDEPTVTATILTPDHVAVKEVYCNGEYVNPRASGGYKVPATEKIDITYQVLDGKTFEDSTTEYTVEGVTPQTEIPASTCNKKVVDAVLRTVSVDLLALQSSHIVGVQLAMDVAFTCATNDLGVISWSIAGNVPFTLTYTSEEGLYFGDSRTLVVAYEDGISADLTVDVDKLQKPTQAEDVWKEVTEDGQHYLQNLGLGWKLYIESDKKTINGITGFSIFRTSSASYTAVAMAREDGVLDLTDVEDDTTYPVVAVGSYAFNDNHESTTGKNTWKLTKFIAPKCQSIGSSAFNRSVQLGEVLISGTASAVFSDSAFNACTSLTNFTPTVFPNVTSIGAYAFDKAPVGGDWVLAGVKSTERTIFKENTNPNGFSVSMPNLTTVSGGNAAYLFASSTITNFSAPKLTTLNSGLAFYACSRLTDVTLSDNIKEMGGNTFAYCSALTNLYPRAFTNLTIMGGSVFESCTSLAGELSFPKMTTFAACTFEKASKLGSVSAPNAVVGSGNYLFNNCSSLTNVVIGGLNGLRQYTFSGCSKLEHIWLTGVCAAPPTNHVLGCFSQGFNGNATTRPPILHVKLSATEKDYSGWEALCNQTKANLKANTKLIANYADRTVSRSRLIGYLGGDVVLKTDGTIDKYYPVGWDLCWFVKWEDGGFTVIVR